MRGPLPRTDLLLVYRWDDGVGLFLEPAGSWSDKLGKNVLVWYLLLQSREGGPVLARLCPNERLDGFSITGQSEGVDKVVDSYGPRLRGFLLDVGSKPIAGHLLWGVAGGLYLNAPNFVSDADQTVPCSSSLSPDETEVCSLFGEDLPWLWPASRLVIWAEERWQ